MTLITRLKHPILESQDKWDVRAVIWILQLHTDIRIQHTRMDARVETYPLQCWQECLWNLRCKILGLMTVKRQVVSNWFDMENTQYCFNMWEGGREGGEGGVWNKCVMWGSHCDVPASSIWIWIQPIVICRVKFPRVRDWGSVGAAG